MKLPPHVTLVTGEAILEVYRNVSYSCMSDPEHQPRLRFYAANPTRIGVLVESIKDRRTARMLVVRGTDGKWYRGGGTYTDARSADLYNSRKLASWGIHEAPNFHTGPNVFRGFVIPPGLPSMPYLDRFQHYLEVDGSLTLLLGRCSGYFYSGSYKNPARPHGFDRMGQPTTNIAGGWVKLPDKTHISVGYLERSYVQYDTRIRRYRLSPLGRKKFNEFTTQLALASSDSRPATVTAKGKTTKGRGRTANRNAGRFAGPLRDRVTGRFVSPVKRRSSRTRANAAA